MRLIIRVLLLGLLCLPLRGISQDIWPYWEIGAFGGFSNYNGELSYGLNKLNYWKNAGGILAKLHFDRNVALRMDARVGKVIGDDNDADNAWRLNRNLNFRSVIYDIALVSEIHLMNGPAFNKGVHPYINAGVAVLNFNPQARYQNSWVDLQPLGTEGQGIGANETIKKYSLTTLSFPVSAGLEFDLGNNLFLSLEFSYRWTITDHLDDVGGYYPDPDEMAIAYGENSINSILADRRKSEEDYPNRQG